MDKKSYLANLIYNGVITVLFIVSLIVLFFVPLPPGSALLHESRWVTFKYFTIDSNVLMGITAIISLIILIVYKKEKYPLWLSILKITSVTAVFITFLVTFTMLGPIYGYLSMIQHVSLYMHLLIPVSALTGFILVEPRQKIAFKLTPLFIIPSSIYGIFYMANIYIHNGFGDLNYDWYGFGRFGPVISIFVYILFVLVTYGISLLLYLIFSKYKGLFRKEKEA